MYKLDNELTEDGVALFSERHKTKWYKRLFYIFRYLFVRPKLTASNLEKIDITHYNK